MRLPVITCLGNTAPDNKLDSNGTVFYSGLKSYSVWYILRRSSVNSSGIELKGSDEISVLKGPLTTARKDPGSGWAQAGEHSCNIPGRARSELE